MIQIKPDLVFDCLNQLLKICEDEHFKTSAIEVFASIIQDKPDLVTSDYLNQLLQSSQDTTLEKSITKIIKARTDLVTFELLVKLIEKKYVSTFKTILQTMSELITLDLFNQLTKLWEDKDPYVRKAAEEGVITLIQLQPQLSPLKNFLSSIFTDIHSQTSNQSTLTSISEFDLESTYDPVVAFIQTTLQDTTVTQSDPQESLVTCIQEPFSKQPISPTETGQPQTILLSDSTPPLPIQLLDTPRSELKPGDLKILTDWEKSKATLKPQPTTTPSEPISIPSTASTHAPGTPPESASIPPSLQAPLNKQHISATPNLSSIGVTALASPHFILEPLSETKVERAKDWNEALSQLPHNLGLGTAVGKNDCFFHAIAQAMPPGKLKSSDPITQVKELRRVCSDYANRLAKDRDDNNWIKRHDQWKRQGLVYETYLRDVQYSAFSDVNTKRSDGSVVKDTDILRGSEEIEGQIICQHYGVKLHMMHYNLTSDGDRIIHRIVDPTTQYPLDNVPPKEVPYAEDVVHIAHNRDHYVPLIKEGSRTIPLIQTQKEDKSKSTDKKPKDDDKKDDQENHPKKKQQNIQSDTYRYDDSLNMDDIGESGDKERQQEHARDEEDDLEDAMLPLSTDSSSHSSRSTTSTSIPPNIYVDNIPVYTASTPAQIRMVMPRDTHYDYQTSPEPKPQTTTSTVTDNKHQPSVTPTSTEKLSSSESLSASIQTSSFTASHAQFFTTPVIPLTVPDEKTREVYIDCQKRIDKNFPFGKTETCKIREDYLKRLEANKNNFKELQALLKTLQPYTEPCESIATASLMDTP